MTKFRYSQRRINSVLLEPRLEQNPSPHWNVASQACRPDFLANTDKVIGRCIIRFVYFFMQKVAFFFPQIQCLALVF